MTSKQAAGLRAAQYVQDGMTVGLGTGSTARFVIEALGQRVQEGLNILAVATSDETEALARDVGICIVSPSDVGRAGIDVTIDGADEVDPSYRLIKGGGGALVREKLIARASTEMIVVVDQSKLVSVLGRFPLPVAIVPFAHALTLERLRVYCAGASLRMRNGESYLTDDGLYVVDLPMQEITDPESLAAALSVEPGVVETGLFIGLATRVVVGHEGGSVTERTCPES